MSIDMSFGASLEFDNVIIECDYTPGREPPPCQNHDSPAFSDCGDGAEVDNIKVFLSRHDMKTDKTVYLDITDFVDEDDVDDAIDRESERG